MAKRELPSCNMLRKLLRYEPETGLLFWLHRSSDLGKSDASIAAWNAKYAGKQAFTADNGQGYKVGAALDCRLKAHRVAWAIYYGEWPKECIDHINGNRSDNRIANLRSVSKSENAKNVRLSRLNTSGHVGVTWCRQRNMWRAHVTHKGKVYRLGRFDRLQDAISARKAMQVKLGFSDRHGENSTYCS
jgi:hypothetical protein